MHPSDVGRLTMPDFWMCVGLVKEHQRQQDEAAKEQRGR